MASRIRQDYGDYGGISEYHHQYWQHHENNQPPESDASKIWFALGSTTNNYCTKDDQMCLIYFTALPPRNYLRFQNIMFVLGEPYIVCIYTCIHVYIYILSSCICICIIIVFTYIYTYWVYMAIHIHKIFTPVHEISCTYEYIWYIYICTVYINCICVTCAVHSPSSGRFGSEVLQPRRSSQVQRHWDL